MNSLSIILSPRTQLGRAVLKRQEPSEIVVLASREHEELQWARDHYPWFEHLDLQDKALSLPDTAGPVRIYICDRIASESEARRLAAAVRRLVHACGLLNVHIVLSSPVQVLLPTTEAVRKSRGEAYFLLLIEQICARRPRTELSAVYFARAIETRTAIATPPLIHTSDLRLARHMMKTVTAPVGHHRIIGTNAHAAVLIGRVRMAYARSVKKLQSTLIPSAPQEPATPARFDTSTVNRHLSSL